MAWKPDKDFLVRRFVECSVIMGWNITGECFKRDPANGKLVGNVGHVFLRQRGRSNSWAIIRIANAGGGETHLRDNCSAQDLCSYFQGLIDGASAVQRIALRAKQKQ